MEHAAKPRATKGKRMWWSIFRRYRSKKKEGSSKEPVKTGLRSGSTGSTQTKNGGGRSCEQCGPKFVIQRVSTIDIEDEDFLVYEDDICRNIRRISGEANDLKPSKVITRSGENRDGDVYRFHFVLLLLIYVIGINRIRERVKRKRNKDKGENTSRQGQ